jgi:putative ABC transport system permease protein
MDAEVAREVQFHLQMEIDRRVAAGMPVDEARRTALRDFGGVDRTREEVRDVRGITFWESLLHDARYGWRTLRRSPGYALAAVLTLGLGIGANTAIFSVINGALLHPLPYHDSGRLVRIAEAAPLVGQASLGVSIPEVRDYEQQLKTIQDVVEYHRMSFVLLDQGHADRVNTGVVSSNYFQTFGITPLLGRTFTPADDQLDAEPVLVLSYAYWQRVFGGDEHVVGRHVQMNDKVHTIVGVLPPIPQYPADNDVYMPTSACPFRAAAERTMATNRRAFSGLSVFGRLAPGATPAQATAEVASAAGRFARAYPSVYQASTTGFSAGTASLEGEITRDARPVLLILFGTTGLILLIACANVANLALSRTLQREREMALRTALGAGRARLVRQLLTESTIVAVLGGALGLALAWATSGLLAAFAGLLTPRTVDASIDGAVLAFALIVSVVTGIVFGTVPALAARTAVAGALKDGASRSADAPRRRRVRSALVVAQVAVCFALVAGAGLFLESLYRLSTVNVGYAEPDKVLTAEVYTNWSRQAQRDDILRFYVDLLDRLQQIPGVKTAAISNAVPLSNIVPANQPIQIEGQPAADQAHQPRVDANIVSAGYFEALDVPVLAGRAFTPADRDDAPLVAVINQSMARLWGTARPVGSHFSYGQPARTYQVVGIVSDLRQYAINQPALAAFYMPMRQMPGGMAGQVVLRAQGDPMRLAAPLRAAVRAVDDQVPVENVRTLEALRENRLTSDRLGAVLLAVFAGLALVITLGGIGAVLATTVSQRTREFGVRMALGASRPAVLVMVLRQGLWLVGVGLVLGVGGGLAFGRVLSRYLYQTAPTDPRVYVAVAGLVVAASAAACLGPARRATAIDPLRALRSE